MNIKLPKGVKVIIDRLEAAGYKAHIVGGSVRDAVLGNTPDDYDITTNALPEATREVFADFRTIETGIRHGTLTVMYEGKPYEVTTYRIDGEYRDNRHPKTVSFTDSLTEDLARRDFTVNAMAYSEKYGLTDPFCGKSDIEKGLIRAVGDAECRFNEDALRILRALRFSAKLGFAIEAETEKAMYRQRQLLMNISKERIYSEWQKLLLGKYAYDVLSRYKDIITELIPELHQLKLPPVSRFSSANAACRMLSLFALNSSPAEFDACMRRLKTDKCTRINGAHALSVLGVFSHFSEKDLRLEYIKNSKEVLCLAADTAYVSGISEKSYKDRVLKLAQEGLPGTVSELDIGGEDIMSLGVVGVRVGEILSELLYRVAEGKIENKREALISEASKML